jgi:hypothetical protein
MDSVIELAMAYGSGRFSYILSCIHVTVDELKHSVLLKISPVCVNME